MELQVTGYIRLVYLELGRESGYRLAVTVSKSFNGEIMLNGYIVWVD